MQNQATAPVAQFDALVQEYYQAWFRFHPQQAVECGQDQHAGRLTPFSNQEMGALQCLHDDMLSSLEEVDYQNLDTDEKLDFDVLIGQVYLERQAMLTADWRFRDPQAFLPFDSIYQLLNRPIRGFDRALSGRLKSVPDYLWKAQELIRQKPEHIPSQWLEHTVLSAQAGDGFLQRLSQHPRVEKVITRDPILTQEIEEARKAVLSFARFLENDIGAQAQGAIACGEHRFNKLLQLQHLLPIDHNQLYDYGLRTVKSIFAELQNQCQVIAGHNDIAKLVDLIKADHPSGDDLLSVYSESMSKAREFVVDKDLVSMPMPESLEIVETPGFLRHQIPFAAYMPPMLGDPQQYGQFYVTSTHDAQQLGEHNFLSVAHTSVHEAYPGHHLQFASANNSPVSSSWPRQINSSATLYEGWALYSEQLMFEQGFLNQPLNQFILLRDRLWRALRVVIDVELHVKGVSQAQAAQKLVDSLGFSPAQAGADVAWYGHAPTVPMSYALGWSMINALRDERQKLSNFTLKGFHDQLLGSGSIALAAVIRRQFGESVMEKVVKQVFA